MPRPTFTVYSGQLSLAIPTWRRNDGKPWLHGVCVRTPGRTIAAFLPLYSPFVVPPEWSEVPTLSRSTHIPGQRGNERLRLVWRAWRPRQNCDVIRLSHPRRQRQRRGSKLPRRTRAPLRAVPQTPRSGWKAVCAVAGLHSAASAPRGHRITLSTEPLRGHLHLASHRPADLRRHCQHSTT